MHVLIIQSVIEENKQSERKNDKIVATDRFSTYSQEKINIGGVFSFDFHEAITRASHEVTKSDKYESSKSVRQ